MDFYLQTRDRPLLRDYRFLGRAPALAWWRERYHDLTAFEYPTVLLESDARGWRMLASAIPSTRRDAAGTIIRWTVVLECAGASRGARDAAPALGLLRAWLEDLAGQRADPLCTQAFDDVLPAQDVADWYDAPEEEVAAQVEGRMREICARLGESTAPSAAAEQAGSPGALPRSWIGAVADPLARAGFLQRAEELLDGARGRALLVNLLSEPADVARVDGHDVVVLIQDDDDLLTGRIHELPGKAEAPAVGHGAGKNTSKSAPGRDASQVREPAAAQQSHIVFPAKGAVAGGITLRVGSIRATLPRPDWQSEDGFVFRITGTGYAVNVKHPEKRFSARGEFTVEARRVEKNGGVLHGIMSFLGFRDDLADIPDEAYECHGLKALDMRVGGNTISISPYAATRHSDDGLEISVDVVKHNGDRVERRATLKFGLIIPGP